MPTTAPELYHKTTSKDGAPCGSKELMMVTLHDGHDDDDAEGGQKTTFPLYHKLNRRTAPCCKSSNPTSE